MNIEEAQALALEQGTRVVHLKIEDYTWRIDRQSAWGNPYVLSNTRSAQARAACLLSYVRELKTCPNILADAGKLRGEVLGCWCAPRLCHGDVLATLAAVDTVDERLALVGQWEQLLKREVDRG